MESTKGLEGIAWRLIGKDLIEARALLKDYEYEVVEKFPRSSSLPKSGPKFFLSVNEKDFIISVKIG